MSNILIFPSVPSRLVNINISRVCVHAWRSDNGEGFSNGGGRECDSLDCSKK